ncbi:HesA/MoeB/ThiF family protein [Pokkaliibacter plantistimulans]|uniref:HesA/MoeB/ThiF family protein n=1 Tax=Pokkaliibacter plantistimulans TaxID=1635171 RepID=UPI001A9C373B|nr:molybdopterin-synthase adenylyltransferase MoeB [Pokkaliibacter plantistimulans]
MELSDKQLLRYSRHIMLPGIDLEGQERLLSSKVLIVGLGGLGCPAAQYLAAAGVGELVLVDDDVVEASNLQRQVLHGEDSLGLAKVESARRALLRLNPEVVVTALQQRLEPVEMAQWVDKVDVVIDCSDNFTTRFALNRACVAAGKPLVSGAAIRWEGQVSVFLAKAGSPCYQCLYKAGDDEQLTCSDSGVAAPLVGMIGCTQAMEALKLIVGGGTSLMGRLLVLDALTMQWRSLALRRDPHCPVCAGAGA